MTATALRAEVRRLLGVPDNYPRLTDANIDAYYNSLANKLARDAKPVELQGVDPIDLVAGDDTYDCTLKFISIATVKANGVRLIPTSFATLDLLDPGWESSDVQRSYPQRYVIEGATSGGLFKLRLWPNPNVSVDEGLVVRGNVEPTSLTTINTGEIVEFPEWIQDDLCKGIAARAVVNLPERAGLDQRVAKWEQDWLATRNLYVDSQNQHAQNWGPVPHADLQGGWESPDAW